MPTILATDNGGATGTNVNDCYGTTTQASGTEITRVIPPSAGGRACVVGFQYEAGATAHTLTMMVTIDSVLCGSEAASGQAVINVSRIPTASDGTILAAGDWITFQLEDGSYAAGKVSSLSGLAITLTANLSQKVLKNAPVYFHGAAADHPLRQFTMKASTIVTFTGGDTRLRAATAQTAGTPILIHSNNATNAGTLNWSAFMYD